MIRASPKITSVERERRCEARVFIGRQEHRNYQVLTVHPPHNPNPTSEIHKSHCRTHLHSDKSLRSLTLPLINLKVPAQDASPSPPPRAPPTRQCPGDPPRPSSACSRRKTSVLLWRRNNDQQEPTNNTSQNRYGDNNGLRTVRRILRQDHPPDATLREHVSILSRLIGPTDLKGDPDNSFASIQTYGTA